MECPKEKCFFWIPPGGAADMSGRTYQTVEESFKKGRWVRFPDGGCSARQLCGRLHPESSVDLFEPIP